MYENEFYVELLSYIHNHMRRRRQRQQDVRTTSCQNTHEYKHEFPVLV